MSTLLKTMFRSSFTFTLLRYGHEGKWTCVMYEGDEVHAVGKGLTQRAAIVNALDECEKLVIKSDGVLTEIPRSVVVGRDRWTKDVERARWQRIGVTNPETLRELVDEAAELHSRKTHDNQPGVPRKA